MTPQEFRNELRAFRREVGNDCFISAGITNVDFTGKATLDCSVYVHGLTSSIGPSFTVYAETWEDLLTGAKSKWAERSEAEHKRIVRQMALAIIQITADLGMCTDAALRLKFSDEIVNQCGKEAVADANKIASNGPFEIVSQRGVNGAPDDVTVRDPARLQ